MAALRVKITPSHSMSLLSPPAKKKKKGENQKGNTEILPTSRNIGGPAPKHPLRGPTPRADDESGLASLIR